jgi:hypothetical protein
MKLPAKDMRRNRFLVFISNLLKILQNQDEDEHFSSLTHVRTLTDLPNKV